MAQCTRSRLPHLRPPPPPVLSICDTLYQPVVEQLIAEVALVSLGLTNEEFVLATFETLEQALPDRVVQEMMPHAEALSAFQQHALLRRRQLLWRSSDIMRP